MKTKPTTSPHLLHLARNAVARTNRRLDDIKAEIDSELSNKLDPSLEKDQNKRIQSLQWTYSQKSLVLKARIDRAAILGAL